MAQQPTSGQSEGDDRRWLRLVDGDGPIAQHQRRVSRRLERGAQQVVARTGSHHGLPDTRRCTDPVLRNRSCNY